MKRGTHSLHNAKPIVSTRFCAAAQFNLKKRKRFSPLTQRRLHSSDIFPFLFFILQTIIKACPASDTAAAANTDVPVLLLLLYAMDTGRHNNVLAAFIDLFQHLQNERAR
jgi:hypothetical protein